MTRHLTCLAGFVLGLLSIDCVGQYSLVEGQIAQPASTAIEPWAACTDAGRCCLDPAKMTCSGNPDESLVCRCPALWECRLSPAKCDQPRPVPEGDGDWRCRWTEDSYVCEGGGPDAPTGGADWSCAADPSAGGWRCTRPPPNPSNAPGGIAAWRCTVDDVSQTLSCDRAAAPVPARPTGGSEPALGAVAKKSETACDDGIDNDGDALVDCHDSDCPPCTE